MAAALQEGFQTIDGSYSLDRGFTAASRLNLQFYLWKHSLGFNLHPGIQLPGTPTGEGLRIADVATGTGIWLFDLARELPSARLDGLDISLDNAPCTAFTPESIQFRKWNVFEEPPADLLEVYDVVHLRLLVLVVQNSNPEPIIRNIMRLLKPGGWLQWDDLNYPDTCVQKPPNIGATPAFDELREYVYADGKHDWIMCLPSFFEKEGLELCKINSFQDSPELTKANGDQHLMTMDEFASRLTQSERQDEAKHVRKMLASLHSEAVNGAALSMPRVVCIGRKKQKV